MKLKHKQLQLIILFSLLFVIIGWTAPMAYATYAPQEQFIEVHEFSADDAYKHSDSHQLCFDRTIKNGNTGEIFIELYMEGEDNNNRIEVDTKLFEDYFQKGRGKIVRTYPLPKNISAGTYRYEMVITLNVANDRVEREFEYTSNKFEIVKGKDITTLDTDFCI
jgi:hypothetical protein